MSLLCAGRRFFLKTAGAAALPAFLGRNLRGANDRINLAFVGTGRRGSAHIAHAAQVPGFELVAVYDVDGRAISAAAAQARRLGFPGVRAVRDFREILADRSVDAVCISTPGRWHASMTAEACQAGKDVWVENPACLSVDEGIAMVQAARRYNRVVQAGTTLRSGAFFRKACDIVRSGELGDIAFCKIWGYACPDIDLLDMVHFAFDEVMPEHIAAQRNEFTTLVTCRYPAFVAAYESAAGDHGIAFHGARATLTVNRAGYSIFRNENRAAPVVGQRQGRAATDLPHWKDFQDSIRSRRKPVSDIETCVRSTITCLLAGIALRRNLPLHLAS